MSVSIVEDSKEGIFGLIAKLKQGEVVQAAAQVDASLVWRVSFKGEPSFRHVNRIAMFRDFLDSLLPACVEPVAAERGSVVIIFAPHDVVPAEFSECSRELLNGSHDRLEDVARFLGISSLEFAGEEVRFG